MLIKAFAVSLVILFLSCSQAEPAVKIEIIRVPIEVPVEVIKEVPVEVIKEVPVEVIVASPSCPPVSEVDWLIWSLEDARAMHQAWADYLRDNPLVEGSGLIENAVGSQSEQLAKVAAYDRRLGIVRQLQQVC
ncbi:hypothetical protein LCGC14_2565000 [marine sediment metagenome]|uniref:Uncharacterized protein n=1 Tax=marine sediment metagenome TaxID=412755 RepID=A0A0F9AIU0_9ZZZZ